MTTQIDLDQLNTNLPALLSATEIRDGRIAVWQHAKSRKGSASRIALYTPATDTYEGEAEATFRAALSAAAAPATAAPGKAYADRSSVGSGDLTGGHDAAPREWRRMNSDTE